MPRTGCDGRSLLDSVLSHFASSGVLCAWEHESPFRSDDPYLVGMLGGAIAAGFAFLLGILKALHVSTLRQWIAYAVLLTTAMMSLILPDVLGCLGEGSGIGIVAGLLLGAVAAFTFPLCYISIAAEWLILCSVPGGLVLTGYLVVWTQYFSR